MLTHSSLFLHSCRGGQDPTCAPRGQAKGQTHRWTALFIFTKAQRQEPLGSAPPASQRHRLCDCAIPVSPDSSASCGETIEQGPCSSPSLVSHSSDCDEDNSDLPQRVFYGLNYSIDASLEHRGTQQRLAGIGLVCQYSWA